LGEHLFFGYLGAVCLCKVWSWTLTQTRAACVELWLTGLTVHSIVDFHLTSIRRAGLHAYHLGIHFNLSKS
jgi:hypothetical protein